MRYLLDDLEKTAAPVGPEFYDAVTKGNKRSARIMMKDSMLTDPSMTDYTQMRSKASTMKDLYDQHDGREFVTDKSLWNDDLMNKEMVRIVGNYSPEREKHLQEVVQHLRPQHTQPPSAPKAPIAKKSFAKPLAIGGGLAALGGGAYLYNRYKKKKRAEQEKTAGILMPLKESSKSLATEKERYQAELAKFKKRDLIPQSIALGGSMAYLGTTVRSVMGKGDTKTSKAIRNAIMPAYTIGAAGAIGLRHKLNKTNKRYAKHLKDTGKSYQVKRAPMHPMHGRYDIVVEDED